MKNLIFIVAYNHENFISSVLERLPEEIKNSDFHILVIDDASEDNTFNTAINWANKNKNIGITVLKNKKNLGYGGNQKVGFRYAIENNFSNLILLHGDGQYAPEIIADLMNFHLKKSISLWGDNLHKKNNKIPEGFKKKFEYGDGIGTHVEKVFKE